MRSVKEHLKKLYFRQRKFKPSLEPKTESVKRAWEENASNWIRASNEGQDIWRDYVNTPHFLAMLPDVTNAVGLDVGFGDGYNTLRIAGRCKHLYAIDLSENFTEHMLLLQAKTSRSDEDSALQNITFMQGDAANLSFPDEHFDFITATMSFMDMASIDRVLNELHRVLRPGGFLQCSILHPCFDEYSGSWLVTDDGNVNGFVVRDYFSEPRGAGHEWSHPSSNQQQVEPFKVPSSSKPLYRWLNAFISAGFIFDVVDEAYADNEAVAVHPQLASTREVLHSLMLRVKKPIQSIAAFTRQDIIKIKDIGILEKLPLLPCNVWWKDKSLVYVGCNERVIKVLGFKDARQLVGKTDHDLWDKDIADRLEEADRKVLTTMQAVQLEEVIVEADGKHVTMLTNKSPLLNANGDVIGIMGISTDITARKVMEADLASAKADAEAASSYKSNFIANMSHDIRTPLSGIIGMAKWIESFLYKGNTIGSDIEKARTYAQQLVHSGESLLYLADQILEVAQMDDIGRKEEFHRTFDIHAVVNTLSTLMQPAANKKGLKLKFDIKKTVPNFLKGGDSMLYRILLNLLSNAVKFTEKGWIKLTIDGLEESEKNVKLVCTVEDTGVGIPKDKQAEVFESFVRLSPSYKERYMGAGLGLYAVRKYVESLDGKFSLESSVGKGSTFICELPFKLGDKRNLNLSQRYSVYNVRESKKGKHDHQLANNAHIENKKTVLVVEDVPFLQSLMADMLYDLNCNVGIAETGEDALNQFKNNTYDLVYMDIGLPGMDGLDATRQMRAWEAKRGEKHVPILGLTAHLDKSGIKKCLDAGMNAVYKKPMNFEQMKLDIVKDGLKAES